MEMEIPKSLDLEERVFNIPGENEFNQLALDVFRFQYAGNLLYRDYCDALRKSPAVVTKPEEIPFLPISFFKTHRLETTSFDPELVFKSSGTTGMQTSSHFVKSAGLYSKSFLSCFSTVFGDPGEYCILGLLPSYLERGDSSLVFMVRYLIQSGGNEHSGFYLNEFEKLAQLLAELELLQQKTILFGVTYALLDFCRQYPLSLRHTIIIETGGMKGRREELTREELYHELKSGFGLDSIYSEYGMTELLSQAYALNGRFEAGKQLRVLLRDETDPLNILNSQSKPVTGAINIIDLANIYSCSFIATDDLGKLYPDKSFEVLGRLDNSDIRGCSQLVL